MDRVDNFPPFIGLTKILSKRPELASRFKFLQAPSVPWEFKELKELVGAYSRTIT